MNAPHAGVAVRRLGTADLADYKRLRDAMLAAHPESFTSDADAEALKQPLDYLGRLGLDRRDGGHFTIGAWRGAELVGAISCDRDPRVKVRHVGHVVGMMVKAGDRGAGLGAALLASCIAEARRAGIEMLTLSVTASNGPAIRLYDRHGFTPWGKLPRAIRVGRTYHDKLHMVRML